jgi:drug/metabolite transporter (DMT)-like permease
MSPDARIAPAKIIAALATLYLVWGSTYLAMNWAVQGLPPFFIAASRALFAGGLVYAWARARGAPRPSLLHWRNAAIIGGLLLLGGNAVVTWASQHVPSGLVALLLALLPAWIAVLGPAYGKSERVRPAVWLGIAIGLAGVLLLVEPRIAAALSQDPAGADRIQVLALAAAFLSCFCWANGSLLSRRLRQPSSPLLGTATQLIGGGVVCAIASALAGEWTRLSPAQVTADPRALLALLYLALAGTLLGYTVYIWLLHRTTPALSATYAYVNPVVAVALGAALNHETMTPRMLVAAAIIITGTVVIVTFGQRSVTAPASQDR